MRCGILFVVLLALGACAKRAAYVGPDTETTPVTLTIANDTSGRALRCLISMAHFITRDIQPMGPGESLDIALRRGAVSNTLYYQESATPLMAVENVYCGIDRAWAETRFNLNLGALRSTATDRLDISCVFETGLSCASATDKQAGDS